MTRTMVEAYGLVYAYIMDRAVVGRATYDELLRAARALLRENALLRQRLRDLEGLASRWTQTPEANAEIVRAREVLRGSR